MCLGIIQAFSKFVRVSCSEDLIFLGLHTGEEFWQMPR